MARQAFLAASRLRACIDAMEALGWHPDGYTPTKLRHAADSLSGMALKCAMSSGDVALLNELTGRTWTPLHVEGEELAMTDHLTPTTTDRGFDHLPPIPSEYGGDVRVCVSSAADGPHVWLMATAPANLNDRDGSQVEAPIHLSAENAWRLAEQLMTLVTNHYQGDARPGERIADLTGDPK